MGSVQGNQQGYWITTGIEAGGELGGGMIIPHKPEGTREGSSYWEPQESYRHSCRKSWIQKLWPLAKIQSYYHFVTIEGENWGNTSICLLSILIYWCLPEIEPNQKPEGKKNCYIHRYQHTGDRAVWRKGGEWVRRDKWTISTILLIHQGLPPLFRLLSLLKKCWLFSLYQPLICLLFWVWSLVFSPTSFEAMHISKRDVWTKIN